MRKTDHGTGPRRFHAYCVGTSKSGTTSLADMLSASYRAAHEPEPVALIEKILDAAAGAICGDELEQYMKERDGLLRLEFESSQLLLYVIDILCNTFPHAKFILTLRDCYSWLDSVTNHELTRAINPAWRRMAEHRFRGHELTHSAAEQVLADRGLYTIEGYLSYWAEHNRTVLQRVPSERLLVVRTEEIRHRIAEIADFLGIPPDTVDPSASHTNKAVARTNILQQIDPDLIEQQVAEHCADLMKEYFPDIRRSGARGA